MCDRADGSSGTRVQIIPTVRLGLLDCQVLFIIFRSKSKSMRVETRHIERERNGREGNREGVHRPLEEIIKKRYLPSYSPSPTFKHWPFSIKLYNCAAKRYSNLIRKPINYWCTHMTVHVLSSASPLLSPLTLLQSKGKLIATHAGWIHDCHIIA